MLQIISTICLAFYTARSDESPRPSFAKKRQCEIAGNCNSNGLNSILIGIDGTKSRQMLADNGFFESKTGVNNNQEWIWKSHVANFWEDYKGQAHYFHGPDWAELILAGNDVAETVQESQDIICQFIRDQFVNEVSISSDLIHEKTMNGEFGIDIIGFSRGGFAAMDLSRKLQINGCLINNKMIRPITVRWLGLYDPVERDIRLTDIHSLFSKYDENDIAENVISVSIAERSESYGSRRWFGYAVNEGNHDEDKKRFMTSHGGIGGSPGTGDCQKSGDCSDLFTMNVEKDGAKETEIWMRQNAIKANVPIESIDASKYFVDFTNI